MTAAQCKRGRKKFWHDPRYSSRAKKSGEARMKRLQAQVAKERLIQMRKGQSKSKKA